MFIVADKAYRLHPTTMITDKEYRELTPAELREKYSEKDIEDYNFSKLVQALVDLELTKLSKVINTDEWRKDIIERMRG